MTATTVEVCTDSSAWDAYVQRAPGACAYHPWVWKTIIEQTYGHTTHYLAARTGSEIHGVLPLVAMKSMLFGHFLVSLPFVNYGGVLADNDEARDLLLARAAEVAGESGAQHVELRQGAALETGWQATSAKVAMIMRLPQKESELWDALSSRLRNKVRNARKHGLECRWSGSEDLPSFYAVFAANMRNLGTPVYPRSWFENVCRGLADSCRILTLWKGRDPVASTIFTSFRDSAELPWIASIPEARGEYSTILLYWTAMEWAIQHGFRSLDLGRCSPGSGTHRFKQQWKPEEVPLHWYYWLAPGVPLPHLRPDNPKYRLAIRIWQKLPLFVTNRLGPRIVRSIP
jgi:FemAB-related protein (PEP-CTERM system-associated)